MKVLFLASNEPGSLKNGPAVILTSTLKCFAELPGIEVRVGLLKESAPADAGFSSEWNIFRVSRQFNMRNTVIRSLVGGPLLRSEKQFLSICREQSRKCDVALWLGSSWDIVSRYLSEACSCPVVFHPTDSITLSEMNRLPAARSRLRIALARVLENRALRSGYPLTLYNSPADATLARTLVSDHRAARVQALPIGVDSTRFKPGKVGSTTRIRVIFSGVMDYAPNRDAAVSLIRDILPKVRNPVELRIVGRNPTPELVLLGQSDPRVVITGAVSDMAEELRLADVFAAPMVSGGGISNKVLEAMACGLPVITTSLVAHNFVDRPQCILVAEADQRFAETIDRLADDDSLRKQLGIEARRYIESWSWETRSARLVNLLRETYEKSSTQASLTPSI